ncbi:MAG: hypothetical protein L3J44_04360 [Campylobacteraceae bacterium]|nr:hypothetical protein [Campylobacteraceae bacterium]
MKYIFNLLCILFIVITFNACSSNQTTSEILQSNSDAIISRDYQQLTKLLIKYKKILDLRNPKLYDKNLAYNIIFNIKNNQNNINLLRYSSGKEYLKKAFEEETKFKSDFLILGIYKMFYQAYNIKDGHHITALGYDAKKFKNLYYMLKVLRWKIRNKKDKNKMFMFATWQLNWQLEYNKRYKNISINNLSDLPSLRSKKESIMNHSNFNFEITITQMLERVNESLNALGEEPLNLSINAMKALIFL